MFLFRSFFFFFFFFNDTATTEIYTLSLHDALPISRHFLARGVNGICPVQYAPGRSEEHTSELQHSQISYAVFCLKKKKKKKQNNKRKKKIKKKEKKKDKQRKK